MRKAIEIVACERTRGVSDLKSPTAPFCLSLDALPTSARATARSEVRGQAAARTPGQHQLLNKEEEFKNEKTTVCTISSRAAGYWVESSAHNHGCRSPFRSGDHQRRGCGRHGRWRRALPVRDGRETSV